MHNDPHPGYCSISKQVRFNLPTYNAAPTYKAALDSAATTNCFPATHRGTNHQPHRNPQEAITAQTANDTIMASIATDQINAPGLPPIAKEAHLFNEISVPLLSVNKLCAHDLAVLFHGPNATVFKPTHPTIPIDGEPILLGSLDKSTELHMVDIHSSNTNLCKLLGGTLLKELQLKGHSTNNRSMKQTVSLLKLFQALSISIT